MAKILIVDDNEDERDLLVHLLTHFGHEVSQAADGSIALELALACSESNIHPLTSPEKPGDET